MACLLGAAVLSVCPAAAQDSQFPSTAARIGVHLQKAGKRQVGVVDFTDLNGAVSELGRSLAEQFETALFNESVALGFVVIDRGSLRSLIREHKLAAEGLIDVATVRKLGQVSGVDCLITGVLTPLGDHVRISIKALDSATARIVGVDSVDVPRTQAVTGLLERNLVAPDGDSPSPAATAAPARASAPVTVAGALRFEASSCQRVAGGVQCNLLVTAKNEDVMAAVTAARHLAEGTRAVDSTGMTRLAVGGSFAGKVTPGEIQRATLFANTPTPLVLLFEDTPAPSFAAIALNALFPDAGATNAYWRSVVIRNVRISK